MTLHTIAPVYDDNSKVLILGSFPSVKSREERFFYAHPQQILESFGFRFKLGNSKND